MSFAVNEMMGCCECAYVFCPPSGHTRSTQCYIDVVMLFVNVVPMLFHMIVVISQVPEIKVLIVLHSVLHVKYIQWFLP